MIRSVLPFNFIKIRTMLYIDVQTDFVPIYSILAVSILFITAEDTYGEYIFFMKSCRLFIKKIFEMDCWNFKKAEEKK